jgi:hypothetical protein
VEQAENAAKQRRLQGSSVFYGDSIQLQHTLTGKYVCVSTTDTSVTENTKLLVRKENNCRPVARLFSVEGAK